MYDIFQILHVDTKEDIYTFCLVEMLKESHEYRRKASSEWGFDEGNDYYVMRSAICIKSSSDRTKIIPDIILYNDKHIAVIESKMYSSEGYMQAWDYKNAEIEIKDYIKDEKKVDVSNASVSYYYFTLAGVNAVGFISKKWADYYTKTLREFDFKNENLEILKNIILRRAEGYNEIVNNYRNEEYKSIAQNDNSWISPFSLFSKDLLDKTWGELLDGCRFRNGMVQGKGHSEYRVDIYKEDWIKKNKSSNFDNIWVFIRIEWYEDTIEMFLNWEYWNIEKTKTEEKWINYIPNKKMHNLDGRLAGIVWDNRQKWINDIESSLGDDFNIPPRKESMLHMIKTSVDAKGKCFEEIIPELKEKINKFEEYATNLIKKLELKDGYYRYVKSGE
ncbi:MAG: hypothetical protein IKP88_04745 [Lachnospiraceae bacterium]|nr:hypothetical protein [Lachnospiraceae bacterium]